MLYIILCIIPPVRFINIFPYHTHWYCWYCFTVFFYRNTRQTDWGVTRPCNPRVKLSSRSAWPSARKVLSAGPASGQRFNCNTKITQAEFFFMLLAIKKQDKKRYCAFQYQYSIAGKTLQYCTATIFSHPPWSEFHKEKRGRKKKRGDVAAHRAELTGAKTPKLTDYLTLYK